MDSGQFDDRRPASDRKRQGFRPEEKGDQGWPGNHMYQISDVNNQMSGSPTASPLYSERHGSLTAIHVLPAFWHILIPNFISPSNNNIIICKVMTFCELLVVLGVALRQAG